jgi:hypothetical protein
VAGLLIGAGWVPANLFYLAAVMMLCAGVAVFTMGRRYGTKAERRVPDAALGARQAAATISK